MSLVHTREPMHMQKMETKALYTVAYMKNLSIILSSARWSTYRSMTSRFKGWPRQGVCGGS